MAKIIKTLRNNWKKSVFFSIAGAYATRYATQKYKETELMRSYCREALAYGEIGQNLTTKSCHVTVILNPAAHNGKARNKFENYCEPLLHLAGLKVSIVRTEGQGQAKQIMELLEESDAVLVAGGDGTIMEAVTGMLRRNDTEKFCLNVPLGILPVGQNNFMAKTLFPNSEDNRSNSDVRLMAEATMSVIRQLFRPIDVMQIENLSEDGSIFQGKKLYGLRQVQVGAFRDSQSRINNYWFLPGIKKFVAHIFAYTFAAKHILWNTTGNLETKILEELPFSDKQQLDNDSISSEEGKKFSYWSYLWPWSYKENSDKKIRLDEYQTYSQCAPKWQAPFDCQSVELTIQSDNDISLKKDKSDPSIKVTLGPNTIGFKDFVSEAWKRQWHGSNHFVSPLCGNGETGWRSYPELLAVRWNPSINLQDQGGDLEEKLFYLDNEPIEIRGGMEITMLPDKIKMFCAEALHIPQINSADIVQGDLHKKWWQRKSNIQSKNSFVTPDNLSKLK